MSFLIEDITSLLNFVDYQKLPEYNLNEPFHHMVSQITNPKFSWIGTDENLRHTKIFERLEIDAFLRCNKKLKIKLGSILLVYQNCFSGTYLV